MKTDAVIDTLARDAAQQRVRPLSAASFFLMGGMGAVLITALAVQLLPVRIDLQARLHQKDFVVLCLLWLSACLLPAYRVYLEAFPDRLREISRLNGALYAPLILLLGWVLYQFPLADFAYEIERERNYLNGGCGAVILVAGTIQATFLFLWLRRGAVTRRSSAGGYAALSAGSLASLLVQFACANEHPIHVVLWHLLPLWALAACGAVGARWALRW